MLRQLGVKKEPIQMIENVNKWSMRSNTDY